MPPRTFELPASLALFAILAGAASSRAADAKRSAAGAAPSGVSPSIVPPKTLDSSVTYPEGGVGDAEVVLELTIGIDGTVLDVGKVEGPEPFAMAARRAAASWKFEPARRDGRPVKARIRFAARFIGEHVLTTPPASTVATRAAPASSAPNADYTVTVRGSRAAPGGISVSRAEARMLPGAFGDPFRAVEALPGVTPVVSALPFFFMRGAPPGNVGYFIDGVRVPLLFHALAGPSVLPPSLVDRMDVYEGAYPARYGRFAGGIIAADSASPSEVAHGEAALHLLDVGGLVEAPFAGGDGHILVAGRYAYAGALLSTFTDLKLDYWDYQLRASYDLSKKDTIGVFGFGALDYVGDQGGINFAGTQFHRVDTRYDHAIDADTKARTAVTLGYDRSLATGGSVTDDSIAAREEVEHHFRHGGVARFGGDFGFDHYGLDITDPTVSFRDATTLFPKRNEVVGGVYVDFEVHPTPAITVRPGLRADLFNSEGTTKFGVDPRLSAEFQVSRRVRLIDAFGVAHQTPNFIPNLPGAEIGGLRGGLQTNAEYSSGIEVLLPEDITTSATAFEQVFFNLSDPLGFSGTVAANTDVADVRALGYSYGAELMVRRSFSRKLGGIFSYTLSRSVRSRDSLNSLSAYDRTHVATLALGYDLGRRWSVGVRGLYASGVPTRTLTVDGPEYGGERAPPFVRFDVRVEKRWVLSRHSYISAVAEVENATAGTEVTERSCNQTQCTEAAVGPLVLPNIGVEAGF